MPVLPVSTDRVSCFVQKERVILLIEHYCKGV